MNLTDDEMRVKCAEALGWTYHGHSPELRVEAIACWTPACREFDPMRLVLLPDYLHDHNAALTLCDRMAAEDYDVILAIEKGSYTVSVWSGQMPLIDIEDPSLARAICLAFLKVHESRAS